MKFFKRNNLQEAHNKTLKNLQERLDIKFESKALILLNGLIDLKQDKDLKNFIRNRHKELFNCNVECQYDLRDTRQEGLVLQYEGRLLVLLNGAISSISAIIESNKGNVETSINRYSEAYDKLAEVLPPDHKLFDFIVGQVYEVGKESGLKQFHDNKYFKEQGSPSLFLKENGFEVYFRLQDLNLGKGCIVESVRDLCKKAEQLSFPYRLEGHPYSSSSSKFSAKNPCSEHSPRLIDPSGKVRGRVCDDLREEDLLKINEGSRKKDLLSDMWSIVADLS